MPRAVSISTPQQIDMVRITEIIESEIFCRKMEDLGKVIPISSIVREKLHCNIVSYCMGALKLGHKSCLVDDLYRLLWIARILETRKRNMLVDSKFVTHQPRHCKTLA